MTTVERSGAGPVDRRGWRRRLAAIAFALLAAAGAEAAAGCRPDVVELRGPAGIHRIRIEVADDPRARARGLMFRRSVPRGTGMLFVYPAPTHAVFWMKNTLVPLDIAFADGSGTVRRVHEGARPGDLTRIDGGEGVRFVLEVAAGEAQRLGLRPGAVLRHPAIPPAGAAWPCE